MRVCVLKKLNFTREQKLGRLVFTIEYFFTEIWRIWESYCVMNCLFHAYSATLFSRSGRFVYKSSTCGFSAISFKRSPEYAALNSVNLDLLTRFGVRCYATRRARGSKSVSEKVGLETKGAMVKDENNSFFVVRKGDLVGVYKNFSDCQAQIGSSVNNLLFPPFVLDNV